MRIDSPVFAEKNTATTRDPVLVIELSFDEGNNDLHYLTSAPVSGLSGSISESVLTSAASTSQKIKPEEALSTIGSIKFAALDEGLTDLQKQKFDAGDGLNGKRVRLYMGYSGLDWLDFKLVQTQVVSQSVTYSDGEYSFTCADPLRFAKKHIFEPNKTALAASLTADQDYLDVFDASGLSLVYQLPSADGKTLLRGLQQQGNHSHLNGIDHIGLIKVEKDDEFEIMLWTGKTGNSNNRLTGLVRGLFGTQPLDIEVPANATEDDAPEITEYIYLEGPAPKIALALMTGAWYGHAGEFLPTHWHSEISSDYVATSKFTTIGSDLWDLTDDDLGFPVQIRNPGKQEAKRYLERNIFYLLGVYPRVFATGEIGLKRQTYISAKGGYDRLLDSNRIVSYGPLREDLKVVKNIFKLKWSWDERRESFSRQSLFIDSVSVQKNGQQTIKEVKLPTLNSGRHSDNVIRAHFDKQRVRYANAPFRLSLELTPDQNDLEVGDVVRVRLPQISDKYEGGTLDRNFEVQSVKVDWLGGRVSVQLFATTARPEDIVPEEREAVSPLFVSLAGTEINAANFPGAVTSDGTTTTVTGSIALNGSINANSSDAVFYCNEDLVIDAQANVSLSDNVQIRVNGFFQNNGLMLGAGSGLAGAAPETQSNSNNLNASWSYSQLLSTPNNPLPPQCVGKTGIGVTFSQSGLGAGVKALSAGNDAHVKHLSEVDGMRVEGLESYRPDLNILDNGLLVGMPSDLRGSSGSSGRMSFDARVARVGSRDDGYSLSVSSKTYGAGGSGGNGGASLAIFSKGFAQGAAGLVDLSGTDGQAGSLTGNLNLAGGAGAGGAPGVFIYGALDSTQALPDFTQGFKLNYGVSPQQGVIKGKNFTLHNVDSSGASYIAANSFSSHDVGLASEPYNMVDSNAHVVFLDTRKSLYEEEAPYVKNTPDFSLTEYTDTPKSPDGDRSTIEVSVTPPGDRNYSYSVVEYKRSSDKAFTMGDPASPEALIEVLSDGDTYDIRVRAVSTLGNISDSGIVKQITTTNAGTLTQAQLKALFPFDPILVSFDGDQQAQIVFGDARVGWSGSNQLKQFFRHYLVQVFAGGREIKAETTYNSFYIYTLAENRADYLQATGEQGSYEEFELHITPISRLQDRDGLPYTGEPAVVVFERKVPPGPVSGLSINSGVLSWAMESPPLDLAGFQVRYSEAGLGWAEATELHIGLVGHSNYVLGFPPVTGSKLYVKVRDTSGLWSEGEGVLEIGADPTAGQGANSTEITAGTATVAGVAIHGFFHASYWGDFSSDPAPSLPLGSATETGIFSYQLAGVFTDPSNTNQLILNLKNCPCDSPFKEVQIRTLPDGNWTNVQVVGSRRFPESASYQPDLQLTVLAWGLANLNVNGSIELAFVELPYHLSTLTPGSFASGVGFSAGVTGSLVDTNVELDGESYVIDKAYVSSNGSDFIVELDRSGLALPTVDMVVHVAGVNYFSRESVVQSNASTLTLTWPALHSFTAGQIDCFSIRNASRELSFEVGEQSGILGSRYGVFFAGYPSFNQIGQWNTSEDDRYLVSGGKYLKAQSIDNPSYMLKCSGALSFDYGYELEVDGRACMLAIEAEGYDFLRILPGYGYSAADRAYIDDYLKNNVGATANFKLTEVSLPKNSLHSTIRLDPTNNPDERKFSAVAPLVGAMADRTLPVNGNTYLIQEIVKNISTGDLTVVIDNNGNAPLADDDLREIYFDRNGNVTGLSSSSNASTTTFSAAISTNRQATLNSNDHFLRLGWRGREVVARYMVTYSNGNGGIQGAGQVGEFWGYWNNIDGITGGSITSSSFYSLNIRALYGDWANDRFVLYLEGDVPSSTPIQIKQHWNKPSFGNSALEPFGKIYSLSDAVRTTENHDGTVTKFVFPVGSFNLVPGNDSFEVFVAKDW